MTQSATYRTEPCTHTHNVEFTMGSLHVTGRCFTRIHPVESRLEGTTDYSDEHAPRLHTRARRPHTERLTTGSDTVTQSARADRGQLHTLTGSHPRRIAVVRLDLDSPSSLFEASANGPCRTASRTGVCSDTGHVCL
jgi:hypothetical protein